MGNFRGPGGNKKPQGEDGFQWLRIFRTLTFWSVIIFVALWLANQFGTQPEPEIEIDYSQFQTLMYSYAINSATVEGRELHGEIFPNATELLDEQIQETDLKLSAVRRKQALGLTDERALVAQQLALENQLKNYQQQKPELLEVLGEMETFQKFSVLLSEPPSTAVAEKWSAYIGNFKFEPESTQWYQLLLSMAPWILMIGFWLFLMRRMQGGGGGNKGIFSFGKSKAKLISEDRMKVTFDDVAGADEAKQELQEIIDFLKEPEKFQRLGGKIPKGALLTGPPGTGKTLLAKAVAGEAGVPFFSMSGADFVEMFVGVGASRVRDLFEQGKKSAPCIIFIDEIDAVGRHRGAGLGGGHDEREQTLNQLLVEMDGFESNEGVILIAATNRPDVLDHALLRPGRFDRQIVVDRPDVRGREGILKVHTKNVNLVPNIDLGIIAKGTPGFSGADLANLVNEAALLAARKNKKKVGIDDLEEAKDKVLMGTERRSLLLSDEEKKNTAYHEAGHALMAKLIPGSDPVHKVTIIPRGRALGATTTLPIDEKHTYSRSYCEANLGKLLGGRVAEKLIFNEFTTGAGNDITRATELARKMVCEWGMSSELGPLTYGKKQEEIFLGREISQHRDYSERTAQLIDQEVKKFVLEAEKRVTQLLKDNIDQLHQIAQRLLEKEVIDSVDIDRIMNNEPLDDVADSSDEDTIEVKNDVKIQPDDGNTPDGSLDDTTSEADTED